MTNQTDTHLWPPEAWRQDLDERTRAVAPEQLSFEPGRVTTYWAAPDHAHLWRVLQVFGRWPTVLIDTLLVFLAEVVLNMVLAAIVVFVIVLQNPAIQHGTPIKRALSHASASAVTWLTSPAGIAAGAIATQIGIVVVLYLRVVRRNQWSWSEMGFGAIRQRPVRAVVLGIGFGLLAFAVGEIMLALMSRAGLYVGGQEQSLRSVPHASLPAVIPFFITTVVTAPLVEESFFRGYALRALTARYGLVVGLVLSSALFAALHLPGNVGWEAVPLFVIGMILGWAYARTGNLLTDMTAHALNNGIGVVLLYWFSNK
jgi:membrane protease YdiL (CAAX protease family)